MGHNRNASERERLDLNAFLDSTSALQLPGFALAQLPSNKCRVVSPSCGGGQGWGWKCLWVKKFRHTNPSPPGGGESPLALRKPQLGRVLSLKAAYCFTSTSQENFVTARSYLGRKSRKALRVSTLYKDSTKPMREGRSWRGTT